jgi:long-subunit fatty acid transport protein
MKKTIILGACFALTHTAAISGGWEASKLSTSYLYEEGNYMEFSILPLEFDVGAQIQHPLAPKSKISNDQKRLSSAMKLDYGKLDIGLSRYQSGFLQFDGQSASLEGCSPADATTLPLCSVVPTGDATWNSTVLLARYEMDENYSIFGGFNRYSLSEGSVTTLAAHYKVETTSSAVSLIGGAYEMPDIALRVEAIYQPNKRVDVPTSSSLSALIPTTPVANAYYTIPETLTLNFQSGIAEGTLLYGTIHQANWGDAQIDIPANPNGINPFTGAADAAVSAVGSSFADRTHYTLGIGRKISDNLALSISYGTESGSGPTNDDPFTFRNGTDTYSISARYSMDNLTVSAGYTYTNAGDVKIIHEVAPGIPSGLTANYTDNNVSGFGIRLGYTF